jgi:hypothetical protein
MLQVATTAWLVWTSTGLSPALRNTFVVFLLGGIAGTQEWSFRLSKRIFQSYRPAYGTKSLIRNGHSANGVQANGKKER